MPWRYTRGPWVCVYDAYLQSIGAIIQYEWWAMCISWWRWMSVCGCSQMRLFSHCLPQRQMVCQCSSRNRAHTDWWESSALGVPSMQMEPPLSQCAIIKMKYSESLLRDSFPSCSSSFPPPNCLFSPLQSKMTTTRSSGDIAVDLTEICTPRISKLSSIESKDQLIMASNGSLISAGKQRVNQLKASVPHQIAGRWFIAIICS